MPKFKQSYLVIGYTTSDHLLLDLDNTSYTKARKLAKLIMKEFSMLGDCVIMRSSTRKIYDMKIYKPCEQVQQLTIRDNYHLIFSEKIGFDQCCNIIEVLCEFGILDKDYKLIRSFRGDMTLRVSGTQQTVGYKPAPEFVEYLINPRHEKKGKGIEEYFNLYFAVNPQLFF